MKKEKQRPEQHPTLRTIFILGPIVNNQQQARSANDVQCLHVAGVFFSAVVVAILIGDEDLFGFDMPILYTEYAVDNRVMP